MLKCGPVLSGPKLHCILDGQCCKLVEHGLGGWGEMGIAKDCSSVTSDSSV